MVSDSLGGTNRPSGAILGLFGPIFSRFGPFSPVFPGSWDCDGVLHRPKTGHKWLLSKVAPRPFGRVKRTFLGHFGPAWTSCMLFLGTGHWIPDTGTLDKGQGPWNGQNPGKNDFILSSSFCLQKKCFNWHCFSVFEQSYLPGYFVHSWQRG